jgi:hypothetical protein
MSTFQDDVKVLRDKQVSEDPVLIARKGLEPTRQEAESALFDFEALCERLRPTFEEGLAKFEQAARIGIAHRDVWNLCQQAVRVMQGGVNSLRSIINRIDGLTAYEVGQGHHLAIPGELRLYRANYDHLEGLAAKLPFHLQELERRVAKEAATARPPEEPKATTHGEVDLMDAVRPPAPDPMPRPPKLY